MLKSILIVGLGGFAGSVLRYLLYLNFEKVPEKVLFPYGTFAVNIIGCLLIGVLYTLSENYNWFNEELRLLLMVGLCGGFTTFSTYAADAVMLSKSSIVMACFYLIMSVFLGLLAVLAGAYLTRMLVSS